MVNIIGVTGCLPHKLKEKENGNTQMTQNV